MSTAFQPATQSAAQGAQRDRSERAALEQIAQRMVKQFPELPEDHVVSAVQGRYAEFEGSRIRDFVPVLVERSVRSDLSERSSSV